MLDSDLDNATINDLGSRIRRKEVSPVEVIDATLQRVERLQPKLLSFVTVAAEHARMRAKQMESVKVGLIERKDIFVCGYPGF